MGKSEFDDSFEKFVNGACTEEERKTTELRFGALPDVASLPKKARIGIKISAKTKIVKDGENLCSSIIWKIATPLAAGCAVATRFLYPRYISKGRVSQHENHDKNIISNSEAMPRQLKLDDGNEARLEPNNILKIVSMTDEKCAVCLEGTAFFNVVRNPQRTFHVHAKNLVTKALGASFTVIASPDQKEEAVQAKTRKAAVFSNNMEFEREPPLGQQELIAARRIKIQL